ncbi:MAG: hypothetical protein ABWX67_10965 [Allosphingosinicella sp.]
MAGRSARPAPAALLAACPPSPPTGPLPYTTSTRYDADGRVTGTIAPDPDGGGPLPAPAVRNRYDAAGRLIQAEQGWLAAWQPETIAPVNWPGFHQERRTDTEYDALDRKTREWTSSGATAHMVTEYSYDLAGRLLCTAVRMNPDAWAAPLSNKCAPGTAHSAYGPDRISKNVYNSDGRLIEIWDGVGTPLQRREAAYTYNYNGQKLSLVDARGYKAEMKYDGFGRQQRWVFPSKTATGVADPSDYEQYLYDPNGNRVQLRKRDGKIIGYEYDALNRLSIKYMPAPFPSVRYAYDLRGLQTAAWYPGTGQGLSNIYDGFGQLASTTTNMGGFSRTVAHKYDYDGRETELTFPDTQKFWTKRDGLGRATDIYQGPLGSTAKIMVAFAWNPAAQLSYFARRFGDNSAYGYDGAGRLSAAHAARGAGPGRASRGGWIVLPSSPRRSSRRSAASPQDGAAGRPISRRRRGWWACSTPCRRSWRRRRLRKSGGWRGFSGSRRGISRACSPGYSTTPLMPRGSTPIRLCAGSSCSISTAMPARRRFGGWRARRRRPSSRPRSPTGSTTGSSRSAGPRRAPSPAASRRPTPPSSPQPPSSSSIAAATGGAGAKSRRCWRRRCFVEPTSPIASPPRSPAARRGRWPGSWSARSAGRRSTGTCRRCRPERSSRTFGRRRSRR